MILIREVPLPPLQAALFKALKEAQDTPIYGGDAPEGAALPYITFGATTAKPAVNKTVEMWTASIRLEVWGSDAQRKAVNDIINDLVTCSTYYGEKLELENFEVINCEVDLVETFPETTTGYHGTISLLFTLNRKYKEE